MNYTYTKKEKEAYKAIDSIEKLRKKLSNDLRPYECRTLVKSIEGERWAYVTNGFYMLKTKLFVDVADGVYKILTGKNEINLVFDECQYPDVSSIENSCDGYSDLKVFECKSKEKEENESHAFCQIVRELKDEDLNFNLFSPVFNFADFGYYQICEDGKKPIKLIDSEIEAHNIAYIMPMRRN